MTLDGEVVYCGYTELDHGRRHSFTEGELQVRRDVMAGYEYVVMVKGAAELVTLSGDQLIVGSEALESVHIEDLTSSPTPWAGLRVLCVDDAEYYRNQRRGM